MTPEEAIAELPEGSIFRDVITAFMSPETVRDAERMIHESGLSKPMWQEPEVHPEPTALTVLRAAIELDFPRRDKAWERDGGEQLVFLLIGSAHPAVIEHIAQAYAGADPRLHLNLLTLVASAATPQGAVTIGRLVADHGWPESMHGRFNSELFKNVDFAEALITPLLTSAVGETPLTAQLVLAALQRESLAAASLNGSALATNLGERLRGLLERCASFRDTPADNLTGEQFEAKRQLGLFLDLAGWIADADVVDSLWKASESDDMWSAACAVASLIRRGVDVPRARIATIAADHAVRRPFWSLLAAMSRADLIPPEFRTRDAFAAAAMVEWLSHPGELGRPPDDLELMQVFERQTDDAGSVLYVWRFRVAGEPWLAATSGVFPSNPPEGPLHGAETFSRFELWSSATAEQHALAILGTLDEWKEQLK